MRNNSAIDVTTFKTRTEIASMYGIHRDTLRKIMKRNGVDVDRHLLSPKEQKLIKSLLN